MELMDTSLDKFYKKVIEKGLTIPEDILGKIAVSVSAVNIRLSTSIPWPAGELTLSLQIVKALEHLHSNLQVIHRGEAAHLTVCLSTCLSSLYLNLLFVVDVKPSNVLINTQGQVKMCDFGISGYLVDSVAKTMDAGCKPYMAVSSTERFLLHFSFVFMSRKQEE